ncbi:MAG TPA: helix-turn-helix transcriptional regulator, partial [Chthoniobacterales bacterium]
MQTYLRLLTHANLQRLFDAVSVLYKPVRPQQLPGHLIDVLRRVIPGEFYGVSVVIRPNRARNQTRRDATLYPVPAHWENLAETFANQYTEFPLRSIRESGNLHQPLALSDIASREQVESLGLYHDYYRILSVADDLSANFGNLGHRVCLAILRERRGFSEQDRTILSALLPQMERAYRYAKALDSLRITLKRGKEAAHDASGASESLRELGGTPRSLCVLGLSEREAEVLYWVAAGKSSPVISMILGIRHDTVRTHLKRIFMKLGVENRLSAALRALQVLRSQPSV